MTAKKKFKNVLKTNKFLENSIFRLFLWEKNIFRSMIFVFRSLIFIFRSFIFCSEAAGRRTREKRRTNQNETEERKHTEKICFTTELTE